MGNIALLDQMASNLAKSWEELAILAKQKLKAHQSELILTAYDIFSMGGMIMRGESRQSGVSL